MSLSSIDQILDDYSAEDFEALAREDQLALLRAASESEIDELEDLMSTMRYDLRHAETPINDREPENAAIVAELQAAGVDAFCDRCGLLGSLAVIAMPIAHPATTLGFLPAAD